MTEDRLPARYRRGVIHDHGTASSLVRRGLIHLYERESSLARHSFTPNLLAVYGDSLFVLDRDRPHRFAFRLVEYGLDGDFRSKLDLPVFDLGDNVEWRPIDLTVCRDFILLRINALAREFDEMPAWQWPRGERILWDLAFVYSKSGNMLCGLSQDQLPEEWKRPSSLRVLSVPGHDWLEAGTNSRLWFRTSVTGGSRDYWLFDLSLQRLGEIVLLRNDWSMLDDNWGDIRLIPASDSDQVWTFAYNPDACSVLIASSNGGLEGRYWIPDPIREEDWGIGSDEYPMSYVSHWAGSKDQLWLMRQIVRVEDTGSENEGADDFGKDPHRPSGTSVVCYRRTDEGLLRWTSFRTKCELHLREPCLQENFLYSLIEPYHEMRPAIVVHNQHGELVKTITTEIPADSALESELR